MNPSPATSPGWAVLLPLLLFVGLWAVTGTGRAAGTQEEYARLRERMVTR